MIRGGIAFAIAVAVFLGLGAGSINDRTNWDCRRVPIVGDPFKGPATWGMACGDPYVYHELPPAPSGYVYPLSPGGRASE